MHLTGFAVSFREQIDRLAVNKIQSLKYKNKLNYEN
jgi:hypothetical protein